MSDALSGLRVWVTRPEARAARTSERLTLRGAQVERVPLTTVVALAEDPQEPGPYDYVAITSPTAAERFDARADAALIGVPVAAVGAATARRLEALGRAPAFVAARATADDLAGDLLARLSTPSRVLLPGSRSRRPELAARLAAAGHRAVRWDLYDSVPVESLPVDPASARGAAILLYSPTAVRALAALVAPAILAEAWLWAIGPTTAAAAEECALALGGRLDEPGEDALLDALARWHRARGEG